MVTFSVVFVICRATDIDVFYVTPSIFVLCVRYWGVWSNMSCDLVLLYVVS
jgi:hypothetical protein